MYSERAGNSRSFLFKIGPFQKMFKIDDYAIFSTNGISLKNITFAPSKMN